MKAKDRVFVIGCCVFLLLAVVMYLRACERAQMVEVPRASAH